MPMPAPAFDVLGVLDPWGEFGASPPSSPGPDGPPDAPLLLRGLGVSGRPVARGFLSGDRPAPPSAPLLLRGLGVGRKLIVRGFLGAAVPPPSVPTRYRSVARFAGVDPYRSTAEAT